LAGKVSRPPIHSSSGREPLAHLFRRDVSARQDCGNRLAFETFTVGCQRCQASSACRLKNHTEILNGAEIKMLRGNHTVIQKSSKIVPLGAPLSLVIASQ
jgi:hypothetical protein